MVRDGRTRPVVLASVGVLVTLGALMGAAVAVGVPSIPGHSSTSGNSVPFALAAAAASLRLGAGPARGSDESCTVGVGVSAACSPTVTPAQSPTWTNGSATVALPPARDLSSMAYDSVHNYVLLFGGCGRICALNDTWVFQNGTWQNLTGLTGPTPPGRADAAMTFYIGSPTSSYILMFGGINPTGFLHDTWAFTNGHWAKLPVQQPGFPAPPARFGAALAFDAADGYAVMFGGGGFYKERTILNDTWEFDGANWIALQPSVAPIARLHAAIDYDPAIGKVVMFGGQLVSGFGKDTWEFSAGTWVQVAKSLGGPPLRQGASLSYYPPTNSLILFGGYGKFGFDNSTWSFANGTWHALAVTASPPPRAWMCTAYDAQSGDILVFGGWHLSTTYNDFWGFGLNASFAVLRSGFLGSPTPLVPGATALVPLMMIGLVAPLRRMRGRRPPPN